MTTILHFLLAILENPHTLIRAQAEVDQVVGADRLPGFGDRASLPYGMKTILIIVDGFIPPGC